jgi:hypothetical protein
MKFHLSNVPFSDVSLRFPGKLHIDEGPLRCFTFDAVQWCRIGTPEAAKMATETGSTVPMRQLGRELRRLRELAAGRLDMPDLLAKMDWTKQKLWRVERGHTRATVLEIQALCSCYGATGRVTEALVALARESKSKGWYHSYGDIIPEWFELYVSLEGAADQLRWYEAELIPGLLQTADYARAIFRTGNDSAEETDRRVELRLGRQARLVDKGLRMDLILDEAAISRPVGGPAVMAGQLRNLLALGELENVSIRVLPFFAGAHAAMIGSFSIMTFPENKEPVTIYVEEYAGALYLCKPRDVDLYCEKFASLEPLVLNLGMSRDFIATREKEFASTIAKTGGEAGVGEQTSHPPTP